jgi:hypothetical protein
MGDRVGGWKSTGGGSLVIFYWTIYISYFLKNILLNFNIICTSILPWPHEIILFLVVMLIYRYKLTWPHKIIFGWNNLSHVVVVICFGRLSWPHEIKYTCISLSTFLGKYLEKSVQLTKRYKVCFEALLCCTNPKTFPPLFNPLIKLAHPTVRSIPTPLIY